MIQDFSFYRQSVSFIPSDDVNLEAWIGAVFRNRFMFFAEQVKDEDGKSLRDHINAFPLAETHPFYKQLSGGFIKGIGFDFRDIPAKSWSSKLLKNRLYTFYIFAVGEMISYMPLVTEALKLLFHSGIGHPLVPLVLVNTQEKMVRMDEWNNERERQPESVTIRLDFLTPVCLVKPREKSDTNVGYQQKLNGFPSFYQFVRSVVYRSYTLAMLYGGSEVEQQLNCTSYQALLDQLDAFVDLSVEATLEEVSLRRVKLHSSCKQGRNTVYTMEGYTGTSVWSRVPKCFLPFIFWCSQVGVGNHIQYGLGSYSCTLL